MLYLARTGRVTGLQANLLAKRQVCAMTASAGTTRRLDGSLVKLGCLPIIQAAELHARFTQAKPRRRQMELAPHNISKLLKAQACSRHCDLFLRSGGQLLLWKEAAL